MRGELVLARGTARQAERAATAEAAELRAQVADLQRRLDDASALVGSVTRAVATRVAGTVAAPDATAAGSTPAPPADSPTTAAPTAGPSSPTGPAAAAAGGVPAVSDRAQVAWRVPLVAPAAAPADEVERGSGPGAGRRDPDVGVTVDVDPRLDPWGRPFPATGSS